MRNFRPFALVSASLLLVGCAGQADDDGSDDVQTIGQGLVSATRPLPGYVLTPHGYYHESCVHELADDSELDVAAQAVVAADGTTQALASCAYPRLVLRAAAAAATTNGWVEDADWTSPSAATRMTSTFGVPTAPSSSAGQVVFFFPGMEPRDGTIILQPVLQWGASAAGGSASWGIASWSCGPSCVHSKLTAVRAGDSIAGSITGSSCSSAGACSWKIVTTDSTTGKSTTLSTRGDTESYVWLFGGVLEAYGVSACKQYPASGKETFSAVDFYDGGGHLLAPAYTADLLGTSPSCSFHVAPSTSGAALTY